MHLDVQTTEIQSYQTIYKRFILVLAALTGLHDKLLNTCYEYYFGIVDQFQGTVLEELKASLSLIKHFQSLVIQRNNH